MRIPQLAHLAYVCLGLLCCIWTYLPAASNEQVQCFEQNLAPQTEQFTTILEKLSPSSGARVIQFTAKAEKFSDLVKIKNCILYSACVKLEEQYPANFAVPRILLRGSFTDEQLKHIFKECPRSQLPKEVLVEDHSTTPPKVLEVKWKDSPALIREYQQKRKNVIVPALPKQQKAKLVAVVGAKLALKDFQGAIDNAILGLGLDRLGASVSLGSELGADVAIANATTNKVQIGLNWFKDPERLFFALRHELEHLQQHQQANACQAQGQSHHLDDHVHREREAHLNDGVNGASLCEDSECENDWRARAIINFEKYR